MMQRVSEEQRAGSFTSDNANLPAARIWSLALLLADVDEWPSNLDEISLQLFESSSMRLQTLI